MRALIFTWLALCTAAMGAEQNMAVMTGPQTQTVRGEKTFETLKAGTLHVTGAISGLGFQGSGLLLTALNASNLTTGTVASARGGAGNVSGLLKANGAGVVSRAVPGTDYAEVPRYPVFQITLPPGFTDFELKASTDNYETMVYFYHSPDPGKAAIPSQIWSARPSVYFTDSQRTDRRQWIAQNSVQSISAMRVNGASEVGGVVMVVRDISGAINPANTALVWTYAAMSAGGYEVDSSGRSIWRPIYPTWTAHPPTLVPDDPPN